MKVMHAHKWLKHTELTRPGQESVYKNAQMASSLYKEQRIGPNPWQCLYDV